MEKGKLSRPLVGVVDLVSCGNQLIQGDGAWPISKTPQSRRVVAEEISATALRSQRLALKVRKASLTGKPARHAYESWTRYRGAAVGCSYE